MPEAESFDLIITDVQIASPSGVSEPTDIALKNGQIAAIGTLDRHKAATLLNAKGLVALPGVIDSQVHFREPGLTHKEDIESGTRAAVLGGVTTVFDEPNTNPTTTTAEALAEKCALAQGRSWCHIGFWVGASMDNLDQIADLDGLPGSPGIGEVFMGSSTGPLLVSDDDSLRRVLRAARRRVAIHAEDEPRLIERIPIRDSVPHARNHPVWRDVESSVLATRRILALSAETQHPVHILHVSTADELPLLAEGKRTLGTTCEITPQHLTFGLEDYEELGTRLQMNTPVRGEPHRAALWAAVRDGLFDVLGSDHAPHTLEEKAKTYPASPSGMPGVQTLLPVMLDWVAKGALTLPRLVALSSANPARLFGLPAKGTLTPGFDADITLVDLRAAWTVTDDQMASKCAWTPFHGRSLTGRVIHTFVSGTHVVRESQLATITPSGSVASFQI